MKVKRYLIPITLLTLLVLNGCRAASYFSQGKEHFALGQYEEKIRLQPDDAEAYYSRGRTLARLGQHEEAIADYEEAIRLQPDDVAAYFIRGLAYTQLDRYAEAITDLETALKLAQAVGNDDLATSIEEALAAVKDP